MKIVEIIPSVNELGGVAALSSSLCKEFVENYKEEIDLYIIVFFNRRNESFYPEIDELGVPIYYLGKKKGIDFKFYSKLKKLLIEIKPDIIHTHLHSSISLLFASNFKKKYKIIHSMHNMVDPTFRMERLNCYLAKRKWLTIVGVGQKVSDSVEARTHIKTLTINNGIEIERFKNNVSMFDRKIDLLCVGPLLKNKNQTFIIKTLAAINNSNITLNFIGDGEMKDDCIKLSNALKVNKQINFLGKLSNVNEFMKNSKILLVASYSEANPIVINEAFASGTYVIATNVGGISDIVKPGVNGDLVELNNVEQLKNAILNRLNDIEFLEKCRKDNKSFIDDYSIKHCAKRYYELFKSVNNN